MLPVLKSGMKCRPLLIVLDGIAALRDPAYRSGVSKLLATLAFAGPIGCASSGICNPPRQTSGSRRTVSSSAGGSKCRVRLSFTCRSCSGHCPADTAV